MSDKHHWERVYATKAENTVSWFQPQASQSMALIAASGLGPEEAIIDVGGGASVLVDELLTAGHENVSVLDLSGAALDVARRRLGEHAASVHWLEADITTAELPAAGYALWHDRAVFHFLTEPEARAAYLRQLRRALKPGGHLIMATFAEDGPERCSGLPVRRYGAASLGAELGADFRLLSHHQAQHRTPAGGSQNFLWCHFRHGA